jgi:hypothetical protein
VETVTSGSERAGPQRWGLATRFQRNRDLSPTKQVPISVANNSLTIALQSYETDVVASTKREEVTLRRRQ